MAKHLLYLTNNQLLAFKWDRGALSPARSFDNFPSGWAQFEEYLADLGELPSYLLTDLIEEDFQRETIPHVFGKAKQNLIERRLTMLYRDTPYRRASAQGRVQEGRKDDQMLFSALTNAQLLKPWVAALQKAKIDVVGIYSVALLSTLLFKKLALGTEPALLVTHQSSGLRQSYFLDGYLRFSRLSPETAWSAESIAETATSEIGKTRQFLASARMVPRDATMTIVVVTESLVIDYLQPLLPDATGLHYRFINLSEACELFALKKLDNPTRCEALFLSLLAAQRVAGHYNTAAFQRFHRLLRLRVVFNFLSAAVIVAGASWAFNNGLSALHASNQIKQAKLGTQQAIASYQATANSMPVTVANPHDMKAAVSLAQMLEQNAVSPRPLLTQLSHALDASPQITIHALEWQTSETDGAPTAGDTQAVPPTAAPTAAPDGATTLSAALLGIPKRPFEVLMIEGEVVPFKNDYRSAIDNVNQLIVELKKDGHTQAELTKPPIDTRPTVKLESQAGNDDALAKPIFSLKLVWRP